MPVVAYVGSGVRYRVMLDSDDKIVMTRVEIDLGDKRLIAELEDLVQAAGLGPRNHVSLNARTANGLQQSLQNQADYVRSLQPHMTPAKVVELMRSADAREWSSR